MSRQEDRSPKPATGRAGAEGPGYPDHRGLATWGERRVPLEQFHAMARAAGRALTPEQREAELRRFVRRRNDPTPLEGPFRRVAFCGGVYSNHMALAALLEDAHRRQVEQIYCLGDLGGFGPSPEKARPMIEQGAIRCLQGNYEQSLSSGAEDCHCGYTDPRDNHFAALSYRYTASATSDEFKAWMGRLPPRRRVRIGNRELLLVHGSPRRINEFLFESTTPVPYLEVLLDQEGCDAVLCTHTGLHWHRRLPSGRDAINVGVIGRPANDGATHVWFCIVTAVGQELQVDFVPLRYDYPALAREMREEGLPSEFVETIETGWWTTCLEILPARERSRSRF